VLIGFGIGGLAILATCLWVIAFSPSLHKRAVCAGLLAVTAIAGGWLTTVSPQARLHHVAVLCDSPDHRRYVGPAHFPTATPPSPGRPPSWRRAGMAERVCVGAVAGAFGVAGEVRLKSFCAEPADIATYGPLSTEDGTRSFDIRLTRPVKAGFAARLSGIATKEAADA
jgi:hypothetical protein